jgi:hypothetical protein
METRSLRQNSKNEFRIFQLTEMRALHQVQALRVLLARLV